MKKYFSEEKYFLEKKLESTKNQNLLTMQNIQKDCSLKNEKLEAIELIKESKSQNTKTRFIAKTQLVKQVNFFELDFTSDEYKSEKPTNRISILHDLTPNNYDKIENTVTDFKDDSIFNDIN